MKHSSARKRFGQHFLQDPFILQKIIAAIHPKNTDTIVEIGPGRGALTDALLTECRKLILVEIDRDLVALLQTKYAHQPNITIHQADALQFNFSALKANGHLLRIIGNLPYNISTPLLFHLFSQITGIEDMHFMLQKEVVMRLTAPVESHDYGRLSVMAQYFCDPKLLFTVPPNAFTPAPRVESAVVRLIPRKIDTPANNLNRFSAIVKEAFTYRRKTIANALKKLINTETLKTIGIDPQRRPQELTVADFVKMSNQFH